MTSAFENEAFWRSSDVHIAVNPHRRGEAEGLAEFAAGSDPTCGLVFFQTSGSEGTPKWCGLSREAMLASAHAVNAHLEVTSHDRWLIALPLYHVGGFSILARCFANGASFAIMNEKWNAVDFAGKIMELKTTLTSLVPAQVFDLVQGKIQSPSFLRAVVVGGAGLSVELGQAARRLGWPVLQSYGMTETASQVATNHLDGLKENFDPRILKVLPIWDLAVDGEQRLSVRGAALAKGYAVGTSDGWKWEEISASSGLCTRDRVELRNPGGARFLKFIGREMAFLKVLGELVNIEALQSRLESLTDMPRHVAVYALPDARRGSELVLAGDLPWERLEDLRIRYNLEVTGIQRIESIRVIPAVPRTALGKLDRLAMTEVMRKH